MQNEKIESLAKKFSLELSNKLEKKEISIEEMFHFIDRFLVLLSETKDLDKINDFIDKV